MKHYAHLMLKINIRPVHKLRGLWVNSIKWTGSKNNAWAGPNWSRATFRAQNFKYTSLTTGTFDLEQITCSMTSIICHTCFTFYFYCIYFTVLYFHYFIVMFHMFTYVTCFTWLYAYVSQLLTTTSH